MSIRIFIFYKQFDIYNKLNRPKNHTSNPFIYYLLHSAKFHGVKLWQIDRLRVLVRKPSVNLQ